MREVGNWFIAVTCWLLLSASMGWYYTITYFGGVGWPLPSIETIGALLLYYFSVRNVITEIQALHWLAAFPLAGLLWVAALALTPVLAQRFGHRLLDPETPALPHSRVARSLGLCSLPAVLPMPYLVWVAGQTGEGWSMARMFAVALRRGNVAPWWWLSPLYLVLTLAVLVLHVQVYRRLYITSGLGGVKHWLVSAILYVLLTTVTGSLVAWPLRAVFER